MFVCGAMQAGGGRKRQRASNDSDEEYLAASDSEDEFYDRTAGAAAGKHLIALHITHDIPGVYLMLVQGSCA
jgi:hypothetical protein